jgi:hypothetical protein
LKHVEYQPDSSKSKDLVNQLKKFQPQAMKLHEEGNLQVPVFNIQARSQGVENYWSYLNINQNLSEQLNTDYLSALDSIKLILAEHHEAKTLAVKKCLDSLNKDTIEQLSDYFINNLDQISGIEKFVIDFAVIKQNKNLINKLNIKLTKPNAEYLIRQVSNKLDNTYIIDKLIEQAQSGKANRFAVSLLKPYANHNNQVQTFLFDSLTNSKLSSTAAFSLSGLTDEKALKSLKNRYSVSDSKLEQNNILLALKLNSNDSAQVLLKQIMVEK